MRKIRTLRCAREPCFSRCARKIILVILLVVLALASFRVVLAEEKVEINFFYSATCPVCAREKVFLEELEDEYPEIVINRYEVTGSSANREILQGFFEQYEVPKKDRVWWPVTFTPDKYFIGFDELISRNIKSCLEQCIDGSGGGITSTIKIPFIGEVDVSKLSLPVLTVVLAGLDGFNPCAMWILLFLIVLLLNSRSRKRMLLIGGVFIAASAFFYFVLLSAWLNLFLAIGYINLTRILIGLLAVGVGAWQIRSFIKFEPGTCKISDNNTFGARLKEKLKNRAEKLVLSPMTWGILGGTVILALGVNFVEFFCSAGLPAIYTRILALSQISKLSYYLYLLLYSFIFMLDDLIIFSVAVIALGKVGFTDKYNYWATLIGGILMLILGLLLIFKPEILMFV